jgi:hypothetical protein
MLTEWTFPQHGTRHAFKATVDPTAIQAYGTEVYPHLRIPLKMYAIDRSGTHPIWSPDHVHRIVWGVAVDLFLSDRPNNGEPVFQSGLQEHLLNVNVVTVSVSQPYIEQISKSTSGNGVAVGLPMRLTILVDPAAVADDPNNGPLMTAEVQLVRIPLAHWHQNILPQLGFPTSRLVPLVLELPPSLRTTNAAANQRWSTTVSELSAAVDLFRPWHFEPRDLVSRLRPAIEGALDTWLTLWGMDRSSPGKVDEALQRLNQALAPANSPPNVRPCNAPQGTIPATAPHKRLCVALTMLHDLMQLSNVESHARGRGTYSVSEAESLLYMVIGNLRSLPELWEQYLQPPCL